MPFRFRLEKVLDYRTQLEERAMQELALASGRLAEEERRLDGLGQELTRQRALLHSRITHAGERWLAGAFIKALQADIEALRAGLPLLQEEENRCRVELMLRSKERKLLDKLREKQAHKHGQEEKLKEQREYDETQTMRRGRQTVAPV